MTPNQRDAHSETQESAGKRPRLRVVALAPDLLFASRIRAAAEAAGADALTVSTADAVLERVGEGWAELVLVDLDAREADAVALIREAKAASSVPVVGFVSHVNVSAIEAAREAGADRVLARSAFVRELPRLLEAGAESRR